MDDYAVAIISFGADVAFCLMAAQPGSEPLADRDPLGNCSAPAVSLLKRFSESLLRVEAGAADNKSPPLTLAGLRVTPEFSRDEPPPGTAFCDCAAAVILTAHRGSLVTLNGDAAPIFGRTGLLTDQA